MSETNSSVREHYNGDGLATRVEAALETIAPSDQPLTPAQLAPLDQFHLRGVHATADLASAAGIDASTRVLDIGCGIGGPARYLAATFGCSITGVDLSPGFIDTAVYLTARCGLSDRVTLKVADALHLPFPDASFDAVFLQHVAMNIADRPALYSEIRRILARGGRFVTYDLTLRDGDVLYPVPWARDSSTSFLLSEQDTRAALERAGFAASLWRDDTPIVLDWLNASLGPPRGPLSLGVVMGPNFQTATTTLARNLRENRIGVLSAVLTQSEA